jgi:hypothetical protein
MLMPASLIHAKGWTITGTTIALGRPQYVDLLTGFVSEHPPWTVDEVKACFVVRCGSTKRADNSMARGARTCDASLSAVRHGHPMGDTSHFAGDTSHFLPPDGVHHGRRLVLGVEDFRPAE